MVDSSQSNHIVHLNSSEEIIFIKILDNSGKIVLVQREKFENIDVSNLEQGNYFLEIDYSKTKVIRKISKINY